MMGGLKGWLKARETGGAAATYGRGRECEEKESEIEGDHKGLLVAGPPLVRGSSDVKDLTIRSFMTQISFSHLKVYKCYKIKTKKKISKCHTTSKSKEYEFDICI